MIKQMISGLSFLPFLLLGSTLLQAQDLNLFEAVTGDAPVENVDGQSMREQRIMPSAPAFTLVGTSRIGGKQRATLVSSTGNTVVVEMTAGEIHEIPDHPGYRVVEIGSRRVSIANPGNLPCVAAQDRGVQCASNGNSELTLATAAPVAASIQPPLNALGGAPGNGDPNAPQALAPGEVPDNPFAAALRAAAMEAAANGTAVQVPINGQTAQGAFAAERFRPRRISPDEVPAGKRLVRTPFGDQLVDQ